MNERDRWFVEKSVIYRWLWWATYEVARSKGDDTFAAWQRASKATHKYDV